MTILMIYAFVALAVAVTTFFAAQLGDNLGDVTMLAAVAATFWPVTVGMALITWCLLLRGQPLNCERSSP